MWAGEAREKLFPSGCLLIPGLWSAVDSTTISLQNGTIFKYQALGLSTFTTGLLEMYNSEAPVNGCIPLLLSRYSYFHNIFTGERKSIHTYIKSSHCMLWLSYKFVSYTSIKPIKKINAYRSYPQLHAQTFLYLLPYCTLVLMVKGNAENEGEKYLCLSRAEKGIYLIPGYCYFLEPQAHK